MPTRAIEPKSSYKGKGPMSVPRTISLDRVTDAMLLEMSGGRYSSFLKILIATEYGRVMAKRGIDKAIPVPENL